MKIIKSEQLSNITYGVGILAICSIIDHIYPGPHNILFMLPISLLLMFLSYCLFGLIKVRNSIFIDVNKIMSNLESCYGQTLNENNQKIIEIKKSELEIIIDKLEYEEIVICSSPIDFFDGVNWIKYFININNLKNMTNEIYSKLL